MRLIRHSIRFTIAACVLVVMAGPASAGSAPGGLVPGPARQPTNHPSQSFGWDLGNLRIPAIGLEETVRAGVDLSVLDRGVGHWAGTSLPGTEGNVVLAGHRTTWSRPFEDLDDLDVGDIVYMSDSWGVEFMYKVTETIIVEPTDMWITYDHENPTLTLFACHPKGSADFRIVVVADLISSLPMG
ncbi:MAG: class E sortase [Actinomycetota bacterium]|nr:class E sortase [Actinomycetota bacterium]